MSLICTILVMIKIGGINRQTQADVKGIKLGESNTKYVVDFSKSVTQYNLAGKASDYSEVIVDKNDCVGIK